MTSTNERVVEAPEDIRERLYALVEHLADDDLPAAARFLEFLHYQRDPVLAGLLAAPFDDEPTTPEDDAGSDAAWEEYLRGESRPLKEVREELLRE